MGRFRREGAVVRYSPRSKRTYRGDIAALAKACESIAREQGVPVSPTFRRRGLNALGWIAIEACVLGTTLTMPPARRLDCAWIANALARIENALRGRT